MRAEPGKGHVLGIQYLHCCQFCEDELKTLLYVGLYNLIFISLTRSNLLHGEGFSLSTFVSYSDHKEHPYFYSLNYLY